MGILDARASVAADARYLKLTDIVDASSDFAPASALSRLSTIESNLGIVTRPATPTGVVQPAAWLRADTIQGLATGSPVQLWSSATGTGDAVPNTTLSGTAPTYLANAVAGKSAVRFTKAAVSKMGFGTSNYAKAVDHTFLVVARHPTLANAGYLIHGINDGVSPNAAAAMAIRSQVTTAGAFNNSVFGGTGSTTATASASVTANTWNLFGIDYAANSAPSAILNGVPTVTTTADTGTLATLTKVALGGYGSNGSSDVDYAEILYFPTQLSATDRKVWEQYLAATYSLTVAA